ncbi:hypothetical protein G3A39_42545 [Paraburkholderia aspalathi]|nr:hypothetical protein [Paraburkholderia aspalathi]
MQISPAEFIINKLGGLTKTAKACEKAVSTVQGWKDRGSIPQAHWHSLIAAISADGGEIEYADFINLHPAPASAVAEVQSSSQCTSATLYHDPHHSSASGGGRYTSSEPGSVKSDGCNPIVGHGRESGLPITGCNSEQTASHSPSVLPLSQETGTLTARVFEESAATHSHAVKERNS